MVAVDQSGHWLTMREAAALCGVGTRTIRRMLAAGAFPNAQKVHGEQTAVDGPWRVPFGDLKRAGLSLRLIANSASGEAGKSRVDSEVARLQTALADAVASAELALMREEMEKWRAIAAERDRALKRSDAAIAALSEAIVALSNDTNMPGQMQAGHDDLVVWPPPPALAQLPAEVRDAAISYTTARAGRSARGDERPG